MTPSHNAKRTIDFSTPTSLFFGELAADAMLVEFSRNGVENACCLVPQKPRLRHTVVRMLHGIITRPLTILPVPPVMDDSALLILLNQYHANGCDGIIACGDSRVQTTAKALMLKLGDAQPTESLRAIDSVVQFAAIPFGDSDGNEAQGMAIIDGMEHRDAHLAPKMLAVDPRFTALSAQTVVAASTCTALMHLITSFRDVENPLMEGWVASGIEYLQKALQKWIFSSPDNVNWKDISSDAVAGQCIAGICAHNRGPSSIVRFAENLAVEGFANRHQTAAALLPHMLTDLQKKDPLRYRRLQELFDLSDPLQITQDWITLSSTQGWDSIVQVLSGNIYTLFDNPSIIRDLRPLLLSLASTTTCRSTT
jgi:alcohol dehydrogenase class IV